MDQYTGFANLDYLGLYVTSIEQLLTTLKAANLPKYIQAKMNNFL